MPVGGLSGIVSRFKAGKERVYKTNEAALHLLIRCTLT